MSVSATPGSENRPALPSSECGAEQPIARASGSLTAFVGRALRGPLNYPVRITSFADFQQEFGGLWQPSMLSYAVEQFFEQGGRQAVIVRVCNGGAPPTITLPCGDRALTLQALSPGTREYLRAAVDYDNLAPGEDDEHTRDCFNLVVQRIRAAGSERIEVQETYRRVSIDPGTQRFVANVLLESKLVRVVGAVPGVRPDVTASFGSRQAVGYAHSNNDGDDGAPLTDYDIIGSAVERTGLFALSSIDNIGLLYIPPLARTVDIGASTLLVAERFCCARRAMLVVDPPTDWASTEQALDGVGALDFHSEHAVMFFPRLIAVDRLRAASETFPNGGAVAGMLARIDEQRPVWALSADEPDYSLRSGARLSVSLTEVERWRLGHHGINALRASRNSAAIRLLPRTLAGGVNATADSSYLAQQRMVSFVLRGIERGTRWVRWSRCAPSVWPRAARQAQTFLADVAALGAFPAARDDQAFLLVCDQRVNSQSDIDAGQLNILVALAGSRPGYYRGFLITHRADEADDCAGKIRCVSINPLAMPVVLEPRVDAGDDPTLSDVGAGPRLRRIRNY